MRVIHNTIHLREITFQNSLRKKEERAGIRIIYNFGRSLKKSPGTLQILTASSEVITQSLFKKFMAIPMNVSC